MLSNQNLKDKIILITGAGGGMGRAASIEYACQGASVILLGKDVKNLEETHDIIISKNAPTPMISLLDLSKADGNDYQGLADNLMNKYGQLDGLLLNAAILGDRSPISQYDVSTWVNTIPVSYTHLTLPTSDLV